MTISSRPPAAEPATTSNRPTGQPPFDPDEFARESETRLECVSSLEDPGFMRSTGPPAPSYTNLRDSCKDLRGASEKGLAAGAIVTTTPTLGSVAVRILGDEEVAWLDIDPRARWLLQFIDDKMIVEEILAVAHVPIDEGIVLFQALAEREIIVFRAVSIPPPSYSST